ncbi:hypothetical protein Mapa_009450 [Marchantia paleacea]|nr:hypothetical protein Mapa_009450 [Marchantia paleacea]
MKEILTLQIGGYANFVGSHFWNFQDEILGLGEDGCEDAMIPTHGLNMGVLYRQGETRQRIATYTPRLLSIDLRGSSGAVNPSGSLYERPPAAELKTITTWHGPAATFKAERFEKNKFLQSLDEEEKWLSGGAQGLEHIRAETSSRDANDLATQEAHVREAKEQERAVIQSLEDGVQFSTDYLKAHLHPSSTYEIAGLWQGVTSFEDYGSGQGLFSSREQAEEIRDKVRLFVEECDSIQGFQCIVDDSGGFSAVAADFLEDVVDEYGRTPISLFTVRAPKRVHESKSTNRQIVRALHDSLSLARLAAVAQLTVPLGLSQLATSSFAEHLVIKDEKDFHTSAVYAAAINCITLPYRMEVSGPSVTSQKAGLGSVDMGSSLRLVSCSSARRVALLEANFPSPALCDIHGQSVYNVQKLSPLTPSTGKATNGSHVAEMLVLQGTQLPGSGVPATIAHVQESVANASEISVRARTNSRQSLRLSHLAVSQCPLAVPLPFPCIFASHIGKYGNILPRPNVISKQGRGGIDVISAPVAARVSTSRAVLPYIKRRSMDMQQLALARSTTGPSLMQDWGFAREEVQELSESLSSMLAAYGDEVESDTSDTE